MSYGAVPFDLAAGSEEWWSIDSSDSAYWAVQENINAMRAAAGLSPLTMDSGLSAAADARCESFVAGGPFDHSGMTTRSEICAAGPIGSASSVCTYWQGSLPTMPILWSPASPAWAWAAGFAALPRDSTPTGP